jgi:hypothetical protein
MHAEQRAGGDGGGGGARRRAAALSARSGATDPTASTGISGFLIVV